MSLSFKRWLAAGVAAAALVPGLAAAQSAPVAEWQLDTIIQPSPFRGVHGLAVAPDGEVLGGSVVGQQIIGVDPVSGKARVIVDRPAGQADDLVIAPDGRIVWTAFLSGEVRAISGDALQGKAAPVQVLATGLPGINSLDFDDGGRLYATRVFLGDALYEIDPTGATPAKQLLEGMGGLNGFEIRGRTLTGPLWFKGKLARVNLDDPKVEAFAEGFKVPAAANLEADGKVVALDTVTGEVKRVDPATGAATVITKLNPALDNLAIGEDGTIYVSNMAEGAIFQVDPKTGGTHTIIKGDLAVPGGLVAVPKAGGGSTLHLADLFAYRTIDGATGKVTDVARAYASNLENPMNANYDGGRILLTSWFAGGVQMFDPATGTELGHVNKLAAPMDALMADDGHLLVLTAGGTIHKAALDGSAAPADQKPVVEHLVMPTRMIWSGPDHRSVYVTETGAGRIVEVPVDGQALRVVVGDLKAPEGLARLPDGRLVTVETGTGQVLAFDPETAKGELISTGLKGRVGLEGTAGMPPAYIPTGIAVDDAGRIWVAGDRDGSLVRLSPR
ncbi:hypothetical protein WI697_02855 [Tistrella mobilis]|uniref:Vgb family protein n=1 Tax=Tistrella mobilis TaxID=171437 RepID=UPI0031F68630